MKVTGLLMNITELLLICYLIILYVVMEKLVQFYLFNRLYYDFFLFVMSCCTWCRNAVILITPKSSSPRQTICNNIKGIKNQAQMF